jgi:N-acetylated-alpha-linked acidic dipeptidase
MELKQKYALHTIWDVIGKIPGTEYPDHWVVVGNHRDAWVFGAVDPGSGTAAMLEAIRGIGDLLQRGWKPKRTLLFASWDAEEQGLIGSTEWTENHAAQLAHAVAYFNIDLGVSGPNFDAAAVPSLKPFLIDVTRSVPSPQGGTVYDSWLRNQQIATDQIGHDEPTDEDQQSSPPIRGIRIGDLGSGSDYTPFLQHFGVPSTDIGSSGPYGVYHSTFDDYEWFIKFADPTFAYLQQQARVLGLEALHMADADLLPYDYAFYGDEVVGYLRAAQKKASQAGMSGLKFSAAIAAAQHFHDAGARALAREHEPEAPLREQNAILRQTEEDLLSQHGLPNRPWFKHTIYAPGEYTGYSAVVIPGVNEAIDAADAARARDQLEILTNALNRAATTLSKIP